MSDEERESRRAILARRQRFVRMAIIGATAAATGTACVCLSPPAPDSSIARDGGRDGGTDGGAP